MRSAEYFNTIRSITKLLLTNLSAKTYYLINTSMNIIGSIKAGFIAEQLCSDTAQIENSRQ